MNLSFDFTDRTVIVTGAARGIGAAIVERFRSSGARVVVLDVNGTELDARHAGAPDVLVVPCDVSVAQECQIAVDSAVGWSGRVDVLVNNAGITRDRMLWKMSDDDWSAVIGVHLTGSFNLTRAVTAPMRDRGYGRIVNVTSNSGLRGNIGQANYAAAKAGIVGLTKTSARELAPFGITVNAISPTADTDMVAGMPADRKEALLKKLPLQRMGALTEIADGVAFLASDNASYITGNVLRIDGGLGI